MMWDDDGYGEEPRKGEHYPLDLRYPLLSYFFGLALADGTIRQNARRSGALSIELNTMDQCPLFIFEEGLPWTGRLSWRRRVSPFGGADSLTTAYVSHAGDLRWQMVQQGFPIGRKSEICKPPSGPHDILSFWRGYFDGDGSIGMTSSQIPFLSLVTKSPFIADGWCDLVSTHTGLRPEVRPNARDGVWNIMVMRSRAQRLAEVLYGNDPVSIPRKKRSAIDILS